MQRVSKALQRHVESTIPSNNLFSGRQPNLSQLWHFDLRCFSKIGRLIKLPDFSFRDLGTGRRDDGISHINISLIVANVLISEFVFKNIKIGSEDIESTLSLMIHSKCEDHDPWTGVEVADWELRYLRSTSLNKRYPAAHPNIPFWRFHSLLMVWSLFPERYLLMNSVVLL